MCSNYSPVSLLSCFDKLFKKVIKVKLLDFVNEDNVLYKYNNLASEKNTLQNLALSEVAEQLYANLNVGNYGLGKYLDFQKAFDTVDHDILPHKLSHCGIQFIFIDGVSSKASLMNYEVP